MDSNRPKPTYAKAPLRSPSSRLKVFDVVSYIGMFHSQQAIILCFKSNYHNQNWSDKIIFKKIELFLRF